jgi:hypothetical protein
MSGGLTNRWSGRLKHKVPGSDRGARRSAQSLGLIVRSTIACTVVALVLASVPATVARATEAQAPRFPQSQITKDQWNAYLAEVQKMPDTLCRDNLPNEFICSSGSQQSIWVFTRSGHPAHPAVSRGVIVKVVASTGQEVRIERSGHYAGSPKAFEAWMNELTQRDARMLNTKAREGHG